MSQKQVKDAIQAWTMIEEEANAKAIGSTRVVHKIEVGQVVRQGDVYIHAVALKHPHGAETKDRQLAIGNTQGSHHVAAAPCKVFVGTTPPAYLTGTPLLGPCVESETRFEVTHPVHPHVSLPAGCFQVTHQLDSRTMQRVRD